jgi:tripartite-type tricarboxylate transporter receptor subunit TctC
MVGLADDLSQVGPGAGGTGAAEHGAKQKQNGYDTHALLAVTSRFLEEARFQVLRSTSSFLTCAMA